MLRIGGVPEHFNAPWHLMLDEKPGLFDWIDFPGGTGAMLTSLQNGEVDVVVALTEGLVKAKCEGAAIDIVDWYVTSPLLWGIHVATYSSFQKVGDLAHARAAISRPMSGSDLMTEVLRKREQWLSEPMKVTVGNLDGGIKALSEGNADYFLWERFTTQFAVDAGLFRRVGELPSPWPCFAIAIRSDMSAEKRSHFDAIWSDLLPFCRLMHSEPGMAQVLSDRYQISIPLVEEWLSITQWRGRSWHADSLREMVELLKPFGLIKT
ncbi:MAG TPA: ABC transporter substrate-binding protein [Luteibaculaceae bacterium]|nr:ABC transporter substrate-binding protein [Luteibaculaceae bacterium]